MKSYQGLREKNLSALITTCWQLLKLNFSTPKMSDFLILNWDTRLTRTEQWTDCGLGVLTVKPWFAVRKPFCTWLCVVDEYLVIGIFYKGASTKGFSHTERILTISGWGCLSESVKKGKFVTKIPFFRYCWIKL